jgi:hypothetical protein
MGAGVMHKNIRLKNKVFILRKDIGANCTVIQKQTLEISSTD